MFNHILVPLDQSKLSEKALPYALHIAPPDGKITLLTVFQDPATITAYAGTVAPALLPNEEGNLRSDMLIHAENYLNNVVANLPASEVEIEVSVQMAAPADGIVDYATDVDIDVIVMCTHGRTGVNRWFMGSITQKVLSVAPCPVIVIPASVVADVES